MTEDNQALVSTIIPAYNAEATIKRATDSVVKQTYNPIEIIVVDDNSNDKTKKRLEELANKHDNFKFQSRPEQGGPCAARNDGIEQAEGEFLAFLDADDRWKPNKIERQIKHMQKEGKKVSITDIETYNTEGEKINTTHMNVKGTKNDIIRRLYLGELSQYTPTLTVHEDVIDKTGEFYTEPERKGDHFFLMCAVREFELDYIPEPLSERHLTQNSYAATRTSNSEHFRREYEKFNRIALEKFPFLKEDKDEFLTKLYFYQTNSLDKNPALVKKINPEYLGTLAKVKYWLYKFNLHVFWKFLKYFTKK